MPSVRVVAAEQAPPSPLATRRVTTLIRRRSDGPGRPSAWDTLTPRAETVATGSSNEETAGKVLISPDTVRTHVSRATVKLGAGDRAQLVVFAYREGLPLLGIGAARASRPRAAISRDRSMPQQ